MSGIVFFKTTQLTELRRFYTGRLDCEIWLEQADCVVFRHGNMLFGFCQSDGRDTNSLITFFFDNKGSVGDFHERLKDISDGAPVNNPKYGIYHFFASDPDGRRLEFQYFEHRVASFISGEELLLSRRSVRQFKADIPADDLLRRLLELCRFAPTSRNSQSYYFKILKDREILDWLGALRGGSSAPLAKAPLAVAVCSDPALSKRHIQDGCIAAYHFILAAWQNSLGTCWIAAMDRDDVKERLGIPTEHYVATITPLGFPDAWPIQAPERRPAEWFLRA